MLLCLIRGSALTLFARQPVTDSEKNTRKRLSFVDVLIFATATSVGTSRSPLGVSTQNR